MKTDRITVDHIAIACRDVESMRAWYEDVLGFSVVARKAPSRPDASSTTYLVVPSGGGAMLELMPDDRAPPSARALFNPGISHIALEVEEFGEWEARLSAKGVNWMGLAGEAMGGGMVRSFHDPEGNMLQIVKRRRG